MIKNNHAFKAQVKKVLERLNIDPYKTRQAVLQWSLRIALKQNGGEGLWHKLQQLVPDLSTQETTESKRFDKYIEFKRRTLQVFQCQLMLDVLTLFPPNQKLTVVDIGDSAGTHMLYLKSLAPSNCDIETISVNLDPRAIEKIKSRGLKAILCRAEDLDLGDRAISFFTSFQMLEHLHNPAIFLRRLAKRRGEERFVITVPYLKVSRVGLHGIRDQLKEDRFAEDEHVFELCPQDWELLMMHSGWKVVKSRIYYQYPRHWGPVSWVLSLLWRENDFEGFWGAVLEKDTTYSDLYRDWEGENKPLLSPEISGKSV